MDPLTAARKAAEAVLANIGEFRPFDKNASLRRPLVGRGFQFWELKDRPAIDGKLRRNWRSGARLGPDASGLYSQVVSDLDAALPGIRKAEFREVRKPFASRGKWAIRPALRPTPSWASRSRTISRPKSFSTDAKGMVMFWLALREPARGPIKGVREK